MGKIVGKNLLPFILVVMGTTLAIAACTMPFLEWNAVVMSADLSNAYRVELQPLPWVTRLGESLDDSGVAARGVTVYRADTMCRVVSGEFELVMERDPEQVAVDRIFASLGNWSTLDWVVSAVAATAAAAAAYMVGMTLFVDKQGFLQLLVGVLVAVGVCVLSTMILALLGPASSGPPYFWADDCRGSVHIGVLLERVHWEAVAVLVAGLILVVSAVLAMAHGVVVALLRKRRLQKAA